MQGQYRVTMSLLRRRIYSFAYAQAGLSLPRAQELSYLFNSGQNLLQKSCNLGFF